MIVSNQGLFIDMDGTFFATQAIMQDEHGIYCLTVRTKWQCRHCKNMNPWHENDCGVCKKRYNDPLPEEEE